MRIPAYAKINLFLDVMERREDGFHNIRSIMHQVSLCDYVSAELGDSTEKNISVECPSVEIPLGRDNLVWRAAEKFFDYFGIANYDVRFTIEKNIPVSAGLAGGSSDAAAAIILLNELYNTKASTTTLCEIGATLGSDIPFCIKGGTCLTTGRGEVLTDIASGLDLILVIAKGGEGVSTPAAYRKIDEKHGDSLSEPFGDLEAVMDAVGNGDVPKLVSNMYNTFEDVVITDHREAAAAKSIMLELGALGAMLSGSGPSVFGIFDSEDAAKKCADKLNSLGYSAHACRSIK